MAESRQEELKKHNEQTVFNFIRRFAPISRAQLAGLTGLSAQTITNIARRFLEDGLIIEVGREKGGNVGRQPINLDIRDAGAYAIGCNIERDRLVMTLVNLKGKVLDSAFCELTQEDSPREIIDKIVSYVDSMLKRKDLQFLRPYLPGIGIGVPGPIDYGRGQVVAPPNFPKWHPYISLRDEIQSRLQIPVVVDNSSNVSALGEHWVGKWPTDSFLYCYWGVGVGAGLLFNGDIYRGISGNSLELGHLVVEPNGYPCECGGRGCLEKHSSIPAIMHEASRYGDFSTLQSVVSAAKPGTPLFDVLLDSAKYFSQGIVSALNLIDVDLIIIGGYNFHIVEDIFLPVLRSYVGERTFRAKVNQADVLVTKSDERAGAIGAASLVFHELLINDASPSTTLVRFDKEFR